MEQSRRAGSLPAFGLPVRGGRSMPECRGWLRRTGAAGLAFAAIISGLGSLGGEPDTCAFAADLPANPLDTSSDVSPETSSDSGERLASPTRLTLQIHGFVGQGALKSTGNNYLADSK